MAKYNYAAAKPDYVAGILSVSEVARKHGIKRPSLIRHAEKHGWDRNLADAVRGKSANLLINIDAQGEKPDNTDTVTDIDVTRKDEAVIVEAAANMQVDLVLQHRKFLLRQRKILGDAMQVLEQGYITFTHPETGQKRIMMLEVDEMTRLITAIGTASAKGLQLERQAFGLDVKDGDKGGGGKDVRFTLNLGGEPDDADRGGEQGEP